MKYIYNEISLQWNILYIEEKYIKWVKEKHPKYDHYKMVYKLQIVIVSIFQSNIHNELFYNWVGIHCYTCKSTKTQREKDSEKKIINEFYSIQGQSLVMVINGEFH